MSTKIYNGYLYKGAVELPKLMAELQVLRKRSNELLLEAVGEIIKDPKESFKQAFYDKTKKEDLTRILDHFGLDELSIVVYFKPDGKLLATLHGGSNLIRKLSYTDEFKDLFSYYGYWNNTDPDEDCTDEEWNQREEDWDFLDVPAHCGLTYEFISKTDSNPARIYFEICEGEKYEQGI